MELFYPMWLDQQFHLQSVQKYYGLTVDGIVDQATWDKINEILNSPFQNGKRHEDTIKLKKDLAILGFGVSSNPTNLYGSATERTIKEFQAAHGLVVNGIADEVTLSLIEELVSKPLQKGMRREDVKTLKKNLNTIGFKVPGNGTNLFGSQTEKKVKEFQKYYGLTVDGIVDQATWDKINEILNSPFQNGKRHEDTIKLKKDLAILGFGVSSNPTNLYGSATERTIKEFQAAHGLVVNGIADEVTLSLIEELVSKPLQKGMRREDVKTLKKNLNTIGFKVPGNGTNLFGSQTEKKVKEFQKYYGLTVDGIVDQATWDKINEILNSPFQNGKRHEDTIKLKKDLAILGFGVSSNPTNLYGSATERTIKEFQAAHGLVVNGIADEVTLSLIEELVSKPLQKGMRREDVKTLKKNLNTIGFKVPGNGTNLFGSQTEKKVKEFQKYYGLTVDGIVDQATWDKINDILNSPFQNGKRHDDTIKLKKDLAVLGFGVSSNPTNLYGSATERTIKEFQAAHGLVVNGIAAEVTLSLIEELVSKPLQKAMRREDVKTLKKNLNTIGFKVPGNGTNLFGSQTEKKVKEFQKYYGLTVDGIVDQATWDKINEILNSPFQNGKRHDDTIKLKKDLAILGFGVSSNPTNLYGSATERTVKEFQAAHGLVVNGIADERTLALIKELVSKPLQKGIKKEDLKKLKKTTNKNGLKVHGK